MRILKVFVLQVAAFVAIFKFDFIIILNIQINTDYISLDILSSNDEYIQIGACTITEFDDVMDCSLFIFPQYRRKGNARKYISELVSSIVNIQFTVSKYNTNSLSLFESIANLKKSEINTRNMTYSFTKNSNICT
jgi:hypothetical protein